MKKRGRPTKLNAELTERVTGFIAEGLTQKDACNLAGLSYTVYREWKAKGDEGIEPYATFFSDTSRVRNEWKHKLIKLVAFGARGLLPRPGDWRAASWLLSRGW